MKPEELFNLLKDNDINCFAGVPDSLLKDFCAYVTDHTDKKNHTITANEGNAIALAAGHYLATLTPGVVYMQNSGIGNCINPLLSLTDEEVYGIPLLMLIGWRGEPGKKDEPQHIKQGKVTDKLLEAAGIKYAVMPENYEDAQPVIQKAITYIKEELKPFAFIIKKGTFDKYELMTKKQSNYELKREEAIETVINHLNFRDIIVSTTGHISREVYETRERLNQSHKSDFLTVGSMGHSSSIALGIALEKPDRNIYCFDGDGAFLMHQGAITVNAEKELPNFKHVIFNNEVHDSVGAQPTAAYKADFSELALDCGYSKSYSVKTKQELEQILPEFINDKCTSLLEIKAAPGARADLGRPKEKPAENKKLFIDNLNQTDFVYKGAFENLSKILKLENAENILVFTGKKSFESFRIKTEEQLKGFKYKYYNDFSTNPKYEEVQTAIEELKEKFDIIVAIGGGSVIDFAKSFKYYKGDNKKLIAIPSTSGTGSEATRFAVIYKDGSKVSLDAPSILPDYAIADSDFTENNPKEIKISCALDAFCQAIESYQAVKSTPVSREYAKEALMLCRDYMVDYINNPSKENSEKMMSASNLAGKAINISRTTASHALSYKITSEYGIPHGKAVALSIGTLFKNNLKVNSENCIDKRGADFVKERLNEILSILNTDDFSKYINDIFEKIGFDGNIDNYKNIDKNLIKENVNIERLKNNPVKIEKDKLI